MQSSKEPLQLAKRVNISRQHAEQLEGTEKRRSQSIAITVASFQTCRSTVPSIVPKCSPRRKCRSHGHGTTLQLSIDCLHPHSTRSPKWIDGDPRRTAHSPPNHRIHPAATIALFEYDAERLTLVSMNSPHCLKLSQIAMCQRIR